MNYASLKYKPQCYPKRVISSLTHWLITPLQDRNEVFLQYEENDEDMPYEGFEMWGLDREAINRVYEASTAYRKVRMPLYKGKNNRIGMWYSTNAMYYLIFRCFTKELTLRFIKEEGVFTYLSRKLIAFWCVNSHQESKKVLLTF